MISTEHKKRLYNSLSSLMTKYDMFYTNYQYSTNHFKSEEEYKTIQQALSVEIQLEENVAKENLIKYFKENFPILKVILYDSRMICLTKTQHRIGNVLIAGIPANENELNIVKRQFNEDTDLTMDITRWESLDEESQNKLKEYFKL